MIRKGKQGLISAYIGYIIHISVLISNIILQNTGHMYDFFLLFDCL